MICTVIDIRGDYAYVRYADTGVVSEVVSRFCLSVWMLATV